MLSRHTNIYMNTEKINFFSGFLSKKRKKKFTFFFFAAEQSNKSLQLFLSNSSSEFLGDTSISASPLIRLEGDDTSLPDVWQEYHKCQASLQSCTFDLQRSCQRSRVKDNGLLVMKFYFFYIPPSISFLPTTHTLLIFFFNPPEVTMLDQRAIDQQYNRLC